MPPKTALAPWKRNIGYVAFGLFSLMLCLLLTFPYDALKLRVQSEAEAAGLYVRIGSLGPGFMGVRASGVQVSKRATGLESTAPAPFTIDAVTLRPSLWPLGVAAGADVMDGDASVRLGVLGATQVVVTLDNLDLSKGNMKAFSGLDLAGHASGALSLQIPRSAAGGAAGPDLGQATGTVELDMRGVTINGGTLQVSLPMYGPEPTPVDLPKIVFGDVEAKLKFDKGSGTLESFSARGEGVELQGTGTLRLAKRLQYSEPNLEVRLKAEESFRKALGPYSIALTQLRPDSKDPKWQVGQLTGYLGKPRFR